MEKFKYEKYDYAKIGIGNIKSLKAALAIDLCNYNCYFNNAAEKEMTAILSQQIAKQIDRKISEYLMNTNFNWKITPSRT